jgi:hypothetical protein
MLERKHLVGTVAGEWYKTLSDFYEPAEYFEYTKPWWDKFEE